MIDSRDEFRLRAYAAEKRVTELESENDVLREARKADCVAFFQWWWNQGGTNTEQGYDE